MKKKLMDDQVQASYIMANEATKVRDALLKEKYESKSPLKLKRRRKIMLSLSCPRLLRINLHFTRQGLSFGDSTGR